MHTHKLKEIFKHLIWDSSYCCLHSLLNQRCWVFFFFFFFFFFNLLSLGGTFVLLYCIHHPFTFALTPGGEETCCFASQSWLTKPPNKNTQKIDKTRANRKAAGAQIMVPWWIYVPWMNWFVCMPCEVCHGWFRCLLYPLCMWHVSVVMSLCWFCSKL